MRSAFVACFALVLVGGLPAVAGARTVKYHSAHPVTNKPGGGYCYIEFPHVHPYAPPDSRMYRVQDDEYVFVGDPTPFGYEGPQYSYYGHHPLIMINIFVGRPAYCYIDGPHYHPFEPPDSDDFDERGGAYWYVGKFEPVYERERPRYVVINEVYRPITYARPVVDVTVAPPSVNIVIGTPPPPQVIIQQHDHVHVHKVKHKHKGKHKHGRGHGHGHH